MPSRLSVLQIGKYYPPHRGGIESHLETLCQELSSKVALRVIVSHDERRTVRDTVDGVDVVRVGTWFRFASAPISPAMAYWIRVTPADVVHIHLPNPTAILAYLASGHPGKLVITYHSDVVKQKTLGAMFDVIQRAAFARCERVIATSPDYARSSPTLSSQLERCCIIPFGVPREGAAAAPAPDNSIRERYGNRIVLTVGRHVYYKGFRNLIEAMREVDAALLMIGDGPLRPVLQAYAKSQGVAGRVHFLGEVENVAPYYHAADVFALPSVARSEAFGIVQLEAMACGLPVVNTRLASGVPFVSVHEQTGLTVPPEDPTALAAALRRILDNESLRLAYSQAARQRVEQEFRSDRMAARTLALYRRIAETRALPLQSAEGVLIGG